MWAEATFNSCCYSISHVQLFATPWTAAPQASLPSTIPEFYVHRVNDAIQPPHPLSSPTPFTFSVFQHQGLSQ